MATDSHTKRAIQAQDLFKRAAEANLADQYRQGNLITFPPEGDLILAGDIHGNRENFEMIIKSAKLDENPKRHLIIQEVVHRYELGADTSYAILEDLARLKLKWPHQLHIILGNHELAEYQDKEIYKGGICLNILFNSAIQNLYKEQKDNVKKAMKIFLRSIPLACRSAYKTFMIHSTPNPEYLKEVKYPLFLKPYKEKDIEEFGLIDRIVWGRAYDQKIADEFCRIVDAEVLICGHRACSSGFMIPNNTHIILDSKDPYACVLFMRLDRHYTHEELKKCIKPLRPKLRQKILEERPHSSKKEKTSL